MCGLEAGGMPTSSWRLPESIGSNKAERLTLSNLSEAALPHGDDDSLEILHQLQGGAAVARQRAAER